MRCKNLGFSYTNLSFNNPSQGTAFHHKPSTAYMNQIRFLSLLGIILICISIQSKGQGILKFNRTTVTTSKAHPASSIPPSAPAPAGPPPGVAPTVTSFSPGAAGTGGVITINGTDFEPTSTVTFGGVTAANVSYRSPTELVVTVASGASGGIVVSNNAGPSAPSAANFIFAAPPTIATAPHTVAGGSTTITVNGTNLIAPVTVSINGTGAIPVPAPAAPYTSFVFTIPGTPIITDIVVDAAGGEAELSAGKAVTGGADLNLPNFGNGLAVVPTPSLDYSQNYTGTNWGFNERLWGNSLTTDSSRQKLGAKLLMPEISQFGLNIEVDRRLSNKNSNVLVGLSLEFNFLVKKVSDTTTKAADNFNPGVFQPRIGFTTAFFRNNFFIDFYGNFLTVVGSNDQFKAYFNTGSKNVFFYPEFDLGGLLSVGASGNSALKYQLTLLVNNGDAQFISASHDQIIPAIKIGFVTTL